MTLVLAVLERADPRSSKGRSEDSEATAVGRAESMKADRGSASRL